MTISFRRASVREPLLKKASTVDVDQVLLDP